VSVWVRGVEFVPNPRRRGRHQRPSSLLLRKLAEIDGLDRAGVVEIGRLTEREFMLFGVALYLGEGFKRDGHVGMANTDPEVLRAFVTWLRGSSTSTNRDYECVSTCTTASIWKRPTASGAICSTSRVVSSASHTALAPTPPGGRRNTSWGALP
jgi:hypothetical protein